MIATGTAYITVCVLLLFMSGGMIIAYIRGRIDERRESWYWKTTQKRREE